MKDKIIVILGPTGSGKTKLAIKIAKEINGEIINADAFQVYKEISIGTAKAEPEEMDGVKFHLNGVKSIYEPWDIAIFQKEANKIIKQIISNKKVPIICGGSNLYIDALIYNYDLSATERTNQFDDLSNEELCKKIVEKNPAILEKIDKNNHRRLVRAAQILNEDGAFQQKNPTVYDYLIISAIDEREKIYARINKNVDKMIEKGWKEEVYKLYKKDKDVGNTNAFKAIGYQIILNSIMLNKNIDTELIKQKTRQYAKRQLTWIKTHYDNPIVYNQKNADEIVEKCKIFIKNK